IKPGRRRGVRSITAVKSPNGTRLCLKGQSQQLRRMKHWNESKPLGLRAYCGWVFDHSRVPYRRFGSRPVSALQLTLECLSIPLNKFRTHVSTDRGFDDMKRKIFLAIALGVAGWLV